MKPGTVHTMWESVWSRPLNYSAITNCCRCINYKNRHAMRDDTYKYIWNNILRPVQTQVKHAAWYAILDFMDENFPSPIRATPLPLYPATGPG
jgi:hypothetical protein